MEPAQRVRTARVNAEALAKYVSIRASDENRRGGLIAMATINKELRTLRSLHGWAKEWKYLTAVPSFKKVFQREVERLPVYVTEEHFEAMYNACEAAPGSSTVPNLSAADWWRAPLVFAWMTGWRIGWILTLRWDDVELPDDDAAVGWAITRGEKNKGGRDSRVRLEVPLPTHLRPLQAAFGDLVFPGPATYRSCYPWFDAIQEAAGVKPKDDDHYSFHDLRRSCAYYNRSLDPEFLQRHM